MAKVNYDKNVDYQSKINEAVAKGDLIAASNYERQRNAKIADMNSSGTNEGGYSATNVYSPRDGTFIGRSTEIGGASRVGRGGGFSGGINYTPSAPAYMTGAQMAQNLGIDYNYKNILSKYDDATAAEYALKNKEYATTENQFYNQMYGAQGTALDTIRKSQAQAIATGASRGLQSANELASMLGLQQETVASATDLAQQRNMLKDKEAGAYTQNVVDATNTYNTLGTTFGNLINNKYAADVQHNVGIMEYFKGLDQNAKNLEGNMYAADRGLEGTKYTADQNLAGNIYTADQNLAGVDLSSSRNLQGQLDYNQTYLQAARAQAEATKYAANVNASVQKAYYDSLNAQGPDEVFSLLNKAKTEEEFVAVLVRQGVSEELAQNFWKNKNVRTANDALTQYILSKPYGALGAGSLPMPGVPMVNPTGYPIYNSAGLPENDLARKEFYGY